MAKKEETNPKAAGLEKMKALQSTLDKIEKDFGKGSIMKMGDKVIADVPTIFSGSIGLGIALGIGGYPRGRVVEIFRPASSGKTTLAIHAIADNLIRSGAIDIIVIDLVSALTPKAEIEGEMGDNKVGIINNLFNIKN